MERPWTDLQIGRLKSKRCPRYNCGEQLKSAPDGMVVCSRCDFSISLKDRNVAIGMCHHGVNPATCYHGCGRIN